MAKNVLALRCIDSRSARRQKPLDVMRNLNMLAVHFQASRRRDLHSGFSTQVQSRRSRQRLFVKLGYGGTGILTEKLMRSWMIIIEATVSINDPGASPPLTTPSRCVSSPVPQRIITLLLQALDGSGPYTWRSGRSTDEAVRTKSRCPFPPQSSSCSPGIEGFVLVRQLIR